MNIINHRLSEKFFVILGLLVGAILGIILGAIVEANIASRNQTIIWVHSCWMSLLFFTVQFVFSVMFKKPESSRATYHGLLLIPISYSLIQALTHPYSPAPLSGFVTTFLGCILLFMWPFAILWVLFYFLFSQSIRFFTGPDARDVTESYVFGCTIENVKDDLSTAVKTMVERSDFVLGEIQKDGETKYISGRKNSLRLGVFCREEPTVIHAVFLVYEIVNEVVVRPVCDSEFLDFKAQVTGLLESWKCREKIRDYSLDEHPDLKGALLKVKEELGPMRIKMPSWRNMKTAIWRYPEVHPHRASLFISVFSGLIVGVLMYLIIGK